MSQSDSLLEVYIFENLQLLDQLETHMLAAEKADRFTEAQVDAIFRILHTVKGSSGMMGYDGLTRLSHAMEDLFSFIRDNKAKKYDHRKVCDLVFSAQDFLKNEIGRLQDGVLPDKDPKELLDDIARYHKQLKKGADASEPRETDSPAAAGPAPAPAADLGTGEKRYELKIRFEKGCKMENVRAFGVIRSIEPYAKSITTVPADVLQDGSEDYIVEHGFSVTFVSASGQALLEEKISANFFLSSYSLNELTEKPEAATAPSAQGTKPAEETNGQAAAEGAHQKQNFMSVRLEKLDKLMDLVGEIVIAETTVTKNPEVSKLRIESFEKASRQLRKLTDELQDTVMSIRMLPISATLHRLERILRDICKKTNKKADLFISGEDTEMDKSVIDNLADPLMHIIRNAIDHGIEEPAVRLQKGKPEAGRITVDARNNGGEVLISVSDDGQGLDREKILKKGLDVGLVKKPESEMTDKEVYSLIFAPGFSTNQVVTEFSGRGVGMDVVQRNVEKMGGSLSVDSEPGHGMSVQFRIPLTLAIITGMQVSVGGSIFILPLLSILKSFKPSPGEAFKDPDGNEMILIRGKCYPIVRLHRLFDIEGAQTEFENGILVVLEGDQRSYCLFVDALIGEQQTVIKPLPPYVTRSLGFQHGISGCTILGDGSVSLILDVTGLME
ncbi:MAG TPA: chemotaxis protein CheA [Feifaniaceae bacterium]|nr:chemotaxis protein CheA [Feifaniaceae bacterium]